MENYKVLPYNILEAGYSLQCLGVSGYAWKKYDIQRILEILRKEEIPVLGGDVYKIIDTRIEVTYDGWYENNNGTFDFLERSLSKTISYIEKYESINGNQYIYALVF